MRTSILIVTFLWQIEPHFGRHRIHCVGVTRYESVRAGQATRLPCEGELTVQAANWPGVSRLMKTLTARLIASNFQQLAQAVDSYLRAIAEH